MENPNYLKELFNVLKNETRLIILQKIVNGRCTVYQLQQGLKKTGHGHSQDTITEEYLHPLMQVGLAAEARDEYYATKFGARLTEMLGCFPEFAEKLPTHSECYEETLLQAMQVGPKTFEEVEAVIPAIIAPRTLKRLEQSKFIETPIDRDYVFFFKTKRDPNIEKLSIVQRKVHDAIPCEGISAGKLAKAAGVPIRVCYKCIRNLKGKKLIFVRRTPKTYALTWRGKKLAPVLDRLGKVVEDTWSSSQQVAGEATIALKEGGL